MEAKTNEAMAQRDSIRMSIPNILHTDVPEGADESGNTVHAVHGTKPEFDFDVRTHNELIEMEPLGGPQTGGKNHRKPFLFPQGRPCPTGVCPPALCCGILTAT